MLLVGQVMGYTDYGSGGVCTWIWGQGVLGAGELFGEPNAVSQFSFTVHQRDTSLWCVLAEALSPVGSAAVATVSAARDAVRLKHTQTTAALRADAAAAVRAVRAPLFYPPASWCRSEHEHSLQRQAASAAFPRGSTALSRIDGQSECTHTPFSRLNTGRFAASRSGRTAPATADAPWRSDACT